MRFPIDGRITYGFPVQRLKIAIFTHCIPIVVPQRRNAQQYQGNLCTAEKYIQWATILSLTVQVYLHSFSNLLPPKSAKSREIQRKFELIAVQRHLRSSTLVPIESAYATSYQLIVTLDVSRTVFEILTYKARKQLVFPTPPLFRAPAQREPVRIYG